MKKRTLALALAGLMSLSVLTACGGKEEPAPETPEVGAPVAPEDMPIEEEPEVVPPAEGEPEAPELPFDLSHVDVTLTEAGESFVLSTSRPEEKVYFGSNDENIATVDENGTVTAVAPGTTVIYAELENGRMATCSVTCDWKVAVVEPLPQPEAPSTAPADKAVDLMAFVSDLAAQHGENFAANANVVEYGMHNDLYPGIGDIATNQLVIFQPMMGAVVCEIALAEVADAADVEAVKEIFQARITAQVDGGAWYPESIAGWENDSRIVTNGNYVMMIAWSLCEDAVAAFNGLF